MHNLGCRRFDRCKMTRRVIKPALQVCATSPREQRTTFLRARVKSAHPLTLVGGFISRTLLPCLGSNHCKTSATTLSVAVVRRAQSSKAGSQQ